MTDSHPLSTCGRLLMKNGSLIGRLSSMLLFGAQEPLLTSWLPSNPGAFVEQETIFNQLIEMTSPQLSNTLYITCSFKAVIPRIQVTGSWNYTDHADLNFKHEKWTVQSKRRSSSLSDGTMTMCRARLVATGRHVECLTTWNVSNITFLTTLTVR